MRPFKYLIVLIILLPLVMADVPEVVEDFCENLDMDDCNNYSYWFEHDECKSQIRCNVILDLNNDFSFKKCETVLRFVLDDCEDNPSSLCFNGVAYDISKSETCDCGGVRFREINSCGNQLEWGRCIDLDSCNDVVKTPHTGAAITVKEECEIIEQDCSGETQYKTNRPWMVTMDNSDEDEDEKEDDDEEKNDESDIPEPILVHEQVEVSSEESPINKVIVEKTTPQPSVEVKESKTNFIIMILMGVVALLFLVVLISWVYVSYFKK